MAKKRTIIQTENFDFLAMEAQATPGLQSNTILYGRESYGISYRMNMPLAPTQNGIWYGENERDDRRASRMLVGQMFPVDFGQKSTFLKEYAKRRAEEKWRREAFLELAPPTQSDRVYTAKKPKPHSQPDRLRKRQRTPVAYKREHRS